MSLSGDSMVTNNLGFGKKKEPPIIQQPGNKAPEKVSRYEEVQIPANVLRPQPTRDPDKQKQPQRNSQEEQQQLEWQQLVEESNREISAKVFELTRIDTKANLLDCSYLSHVKYRVGTPMKGQKIETYMGKLIFRNISDAFLQHRLCGREEQESLYADILLPMCGLDHCYQKVRRGAESHQTRQKRTQKQADRESRAENESSQQDNQRRKKTIRCHSHISKWKQGTVKGEPGAEETAESRLLLADVNDALANLGEKVSPTTGLVTPTNKTGATAGYSSS